MLFDGAYKPRARVRNLVPHGGRKLTRKPRQLPPHLGSGLPTPSADKPRSPVRPSKAESAPHREGWRGFQVRVVLGFRPALVSDVRHTQPLMLTYQE